MALRWGAAFWQTLTKADLRKGRVEGLCVAKRLHMTWVAGSRRWRKLYKGKWYAVSCRQLGCEETKEASWKLANDWWERKQGLAHRGGSPGQRRQGVGDGRGLEAA